MMKSAGVDKMHRPAKPSPNERLPGASFTTVLVLLGSICALVVLLMLVYADRVRDELAYQSSSRLLDGLVRMKERHLRENLRSYTLWDEAIQHVVIQPDTDWWLENAGGFTVDTFRLSFSLAVDASNQPRLMSTSEEPWVERLPEGLSASMQALLSQARARPVVVDAGEAVATGFVRMDDEIFLAVAARFLAESDDMVNPDPDALLIFGVSLSRSLFEEIGAIMGRSLRFEATADAHSHGVPLALSDGLRIGQVVWEEPDTGWPLMAFAIPGLIGATLVIVFLGFFTVHAKRVVTQLQLIEKQRKQQEEQTRRIGEVLNLTGQIAGIGAWEFDPDLAQLWWSDETFRIHGMVPGEQPGVEQAIEFYLPEDQPVIQTAVERCLAEGVPFDLTLRIRRVDGTCAWVRSMGRADDDHCDLRGAGRRRLVGAFHDITSQKQSEDKLRQAASVFEHANEGIMITDDQGVILDVNEAFSRITGYLPHEAIGNTPRMLQSGRHDQAFYAVMWQTLRKHGNWTGEIWSRRKDGTVFAEMQTISAVPDADGRVQRFVALFSDITAQKAHQLQLERIAHYDALTGLPNRVLLADRMQQSMAQALRRHEQLAVVYLDLDGFKAINDAHGHDVGDHLLVTLAERMKKALREGDTLARLGGDEFVAVLVDLGGIEACLPLLSRLLHAVSEPVQSDALYLRVSASLGVSLFPQTDPIDADQLMRQADQAMYQAKLAGKNRYHVFDAAEDRSMRGRHEHIERARVGLEAGEFVLYYQPKVNMRRGVVVGAEALIRWQHPEQGLLSPAAFLPMLVNHGLMVELGDWVIDTALAQVEQWHASGLVLPVSVNVDVMQLAQPDFIDKLQAALARHPGIQSGDLELEVLETSAIEDITGVSSIMAACKAFGVQFSLDDFGTGYSSLTYLKRLPVHCLKIDQSFVRDMLDDPDDLAILKGVIHLAETFRRAVIAEGVETDFHGQKLLQLGCELGQGYAIAAPMPAQALPSWIAEWQPPACWRTQLAPTSPDPAHD